MMDQRERLIADLRAAVEAEWAKSPFHQADEWDGQDEERAASFADHLIASGWVRWDEAQAVCRNTAHDALHDAIYEINECARVQSAVDEALVALTPLKGTER